MAENDTTQQIAEQKKMIQHAMSRIRVNIALGNELKILFDRMGINVWEVIEAAKTKPFGFQAFYPGPGLGGAGRAVAGARCRRR